MMSARHRSPAQQEDPPMDKKAKTPKKPKTAKPKGTKTA
jgi:hypothetical protein